MLYNMGQCDRIQSHLKVGVFELQTLQLLLLLLETQDPERKYSFKSLSTSATHKTEIEFRDVIGDKTHDLSANISLLFYRVKMFSFSL